MITYDYYGIRLQLSTADSETHKVRVLRAYSRYETRVNSIRKFFANVRLVDIYLKMSMKIYMRRKAQETAGDEWKTNKCRNNVKKKRNETRNENMTIFRAVHTHD